MSSFIVHAWSVITYPWFEKDLIEKTLSTTVKVETKKRSLILVARQRQYVCVQRVVYWVSLRVTFFFPLSEAIKCSLSHSYYPTSSNFLRGTPCIFSLYISLPFHFFPPLIPRILFLTFSPASLFQIVFFKLWKLPLLLFWNKQVALHCSSIQFSQWKRLNEKSKGIYRVLEIWENN